MSLSVSPSRSGENQQHRPSPKGKRNRSSKRTDRDEPTPLETPQAARRDSWGFPPPQASPTGKENEPVDATPFPSRDSVASLPLAESSTNILEQTIRHRPHYSSLPSSPRLNSPSKARSNPIPETPHVPRNPTSFSLWDYVKAELLADDILVEKDLRWERVSNFLAVPLAVEKIILFGYVLCLDAFLHTFTIQPIRTVLALAQLCKRIALRSTQRLHLSYKADLVRALIIIIPLVTLLPVVDVSKIYHSIRGQETIKLYVIFNALEIADRLFTSFGEDLQECLFSKTSLTQLSFATPLSNLLRLSCYFLLTILNTLVHSVILIYQLTSLNVAINSFDQSLLTLLVSNQFVEIKGSVFKKFEKDSLFQITCADIIERFQLSLMLVTIAFRTGVELSVMDFETSILPKSFGWAARHRNILWTITMPVVSVLCSEVIVDWLKHAFITKFNHLRPTIYGRYTDILCNDIIKSSNTTVSKSDSAFVDRAPYVTRRLGLPTLPLGVATVLVCSQAMGAGTNSVRIPDWRGWDMTSVVRGVQYGVLYFTIWLCLIAVKVMLGVQLITYALRRQRGMRSREVEEVANDGKKPIGQSLEEKARADEIAKIFEEDSRRNGEPVKDKRTIPLEDVTRFTMTKRIW